MKNILEIANRRAVVVVLFIIVTCVCIVHIYLQTKYV